MEIIDRGLGWLGRVLLTAGLIVGVVIPPMLLKLINQLYRQHQLTAWQITLAGVYLLIFVILALAATALMRHYTGNYQSENLQYHDWQIIGMAYLTILIFEGGFQFINQLLYHQNQTQNNAAIKNLMAGSPLSLWLMALSAVFLTPIVEELIFRGVLTNLFFQKEWLKVGLSGIVFGSLHSSSTLPSFLIYVTMGLVLAIVYRLTRKIRAAIALHFVINSLAITIMLLH